MWQGVGGSFDRLVPGDRAMYGYAEATGSLARYSGDPGAWNSFPRVPVDRVTAMTANAEGLYVSGDNGTYWYDEVAQIWSRVSDVTFEWLVGAGHTLYGLDDTATAHWFDAGNRAWLPIGPSKVVGHIDANYRYAVALSPDWSNALLFDSLAPTAGWQTLGKAMSYLAAADNGVYGLDDRKGAHVFDVAAGDWVYVGGPFDSIMANGLNVVAEADGTFYVFTGDAWDWTPLDDIDAIGAAMTSDYLFALSQDRSASLCDLQPPPPFESVGSGLGFNWLWQFETADKIFAGFDGHVVMKVWYDGESTDRTLPTTHFVRGAGYAFPMRIPPADLEYIQLTGTDNFFNEHWTVATITGWSMRSRKAYVFDVDADVPNFKEGWGTYKPARTFAANVPSFGPILYIWKSRLLEAVGHASLTLSDGTHISWWPKGKSVTGISLIDQYVNVPANDPQTFLDDVNLERQPPDYGIPVKGMNEDAIRAWWADFKRTHLYNLLTQNCAATVKDALVQGGMKVRISPSIWTPNEVLKAVFHHNTSP